MVLFQLSINGSAKISSLDDRRRHCVFVDEAGKPELTQTWMPLVCQSVLSLKTTLWIFDRWVHPRFIMSGQNRYKSTQCFMPRRLEGWLHCLHLLTMTSSKHLPAQVHSLVKKKKNYKLSTIRQPPHRGLIAENCKSPLSEEIFSSNFQHW